MFSQINPTKSLQSCTLKNYSHFPFVPISQDQTCRLKVIDLFIRHNGIQSNVGIITRQGYQVPLISTTFCTTVIDKTDSILWKPFMTATFRFDIVFMS